MRVHKSIQVIFESKNAPTTHNDGWYDYCREQSPHGMDRSKAETWATAWCDTLEQRERCKFRYRIEVWH